MTKLWVRLRQAGRWTWALLAGVGAWALWTYLRKRPGPLADPAGDAISRSRQMREAATARAALELAVIRGDARANAHELGEILDETDEDLQATRLINMAKRVRGEP